MYAPNICILICSQVRDTYVAKGTYAFIYSNTRILQVNLWYLYIPYIFVRIYGALESSAWYQMVPACSSSYGWIFSLVISVHITTKFHHHKPALDASGGEWRCKYDASTRPRGRNRWCFGGVRGTKLSAHKKEEITILLQKPTLWANVLGTFS